MSQQETRESSRDRGGKRKSVLRSVSRKAVMQMSAAWIFAYGSLLNSCSRARTGTSRIAIPVSVVGLRRAWCAVVDEERFTALGVVPHHSSTSNGILVMVPELASFDEREQGYTRTPLRRQSVRGWNGQPLPDAECEVYIPNAPGLPSTRAPILQSYTDVCLDGAPPLRDRVRR